jgi:hypothetical protein
MEAHSGELVLSTLFGLSAMTSAVVWFFEDDDMITEIERKWSVVG